MAGFVGPLMNVMILHGKSSASTYHRRKFLLGFHSIEQLKRRTQLLLPPTLNVAFRFFEPRIVEPFPNKKLLGKKKIAATEQTIFHWEIALQFTVQKI